MTFTGFSPRRVLFAFAAALVCGLVVFSLPSLVWSAVPRALQQADTAQALVPAS